MAGFTPAIFRSNPPELLKKQLKKMCRNCRLCHDWIFVSTYTLYHNLFLLSSVNNWRVESVENDFGNRIYKELMSMNRSISVKTLKWSLIQWECSYG